MDHPEPSDSTEPYRRLTLFDLMGLVAASGVGLLGWMMYQPHAGRTVDRPHNLLEWLHLLALQCLALAWWVVLGGLKSARLERREPGYLTAASMIVGSFFGIAAQFLFQTPDVSSSGLPVARVLLRSLLTSCTYFGMPATAAGVPVAWLALSLLGGWKRAGSTRAWLGLGLGWALLLLLAATLIKAGWIH